MTSAPLMTTSMELQIPLTLINPNLDEIQSYFAQVLNNITDMTKDITMWGQRNLNKKDNRKRTTLRFNGTLSKVRTREVSQFLFSLYQDLMTKERAIV